MNKGTMAKAALGTLGTGSVAAPSAVAVQKSQQASALAQEMEEKSLQVTKLTEEVDRKGEDLKNRATEADELNKKLVDEANRYKELYGQEQAKNNADRANRQQTLDENAALRKKVEDLQVALAKEKQLVETQKTTFTEQWKKLNQQLQDLRNKSPR